MTEFFFQVLHVELALTISEAPLHRGPGADKAQVNGVEIQETAAGHALKENPIPFRRPWKTLVADRKPFSAPMRDLKVRVLQVEDVNQLVPHHASPVKRAMDSLGVGRSHGDH